MTRPRERRVDAAVLALALLGLSGCRGSAVVQGDAQSRIELLNADYKATASLGARRAVAIDQSGNLTRYALIGPAAQKQFLLVLFPQRVDGKIVVPTTDAAAPGGETDEAVAAENRYLDLVLRAHREILAGDVARARLTLDAAEQEFDPGYATEVLRGLAAVLAGDAAEASRRFRVAQEYAPKGVDLGALVPTKGAAP